MFLRLHAILVFSIVCVLVVFADVNADEPVCFKCHSKKTFNNSVVHEPVSKGKCTDCHNPHVARHEHLLQVQGGDFCFTCHKKEERQYMSGIVHAPLKKGQCLVCHDPHTSTAKGLLKSHGASSICFDCHTTLSRHFTYEHQPFSKGNCSACHSPHQSQYSLLLKDKPDSLCGKCHSAKDMQKAHSGYPENLKNCLSCHHPHGSDRIGLVRNNLHKPYTEGCTECHGTNKNDAENCFRCHEDVKGQMMSKHNHLLSFQKNSCLLCHSSHAADDNNLLKGPEEMICRDCHEERFKNAENRLHKHPDSTICLNCHTVHGSNEVAMLRGGGIGVCERCHKTQGQFSHPVGDKVLDPRTGQKMTCVDCHYPHGTDYKFSLKLSGSKDLCIQCHRGY